MAQIQENANETFDVIICGCGPTGAMLSVLLSLYGVKHLVIEREAEINADPRGIALDEDGIRCLQACGIYDKIFTDIGQCMTKFLFVGGVHQDFRRKPFMTINFETSEGGTGHPGFMCHKQPRIEKHLRDQITRLGCGQMQLGSEVTDIREDADAVYVSYTNSSAVSHTVKGKFLVGADGKTGYTRKKYLEAKGIQLLETSQTKYEKEWVALNWHISLPTPTTHPDFPLWRKGYTPEQVYDEFFPSTFRFLCNHARPAVCGRFGLQSDRLWRFEFVVLDNEDPMEMATWSKISEVVHPYITHTGKKYGLADQSIIYPLDCIEVLRCRPFRFSARSCNKWSLDRVMLYSNAAHVFPPFGGQGIASGFRDAISIAWRLRMATEVSAAEKMGFDFRKLFQGWYSERKQQLEKSLALTVANGERVNESNPFKVFVRDWMLWFIQLVPSWRRDLESTGRNKPTFQYTWENDKGMAFLPTLGGGKNFVQVYAAKVTNDRNNVDVSFTDDLIFHPSKTALFQLLMILPGDTSADTELSGLLDVEKISGGAVKSSEATLIINSTGSVVSAIGGHECYRLATAEEFAAHPTLCAGRPAPMGFDPYRMSREVHDRKFVILRPDRVVFAACDHMEDLLFATEKLRQFVSAGELSDISS